MTSREMLGLIRNVGVLVGYILGRPHHYGTRAAKFKVLGVGGRLSVLGA